jgi:uncharacterized protein (DUF2141 family)
MRRHLLLAFGLLALLGQDCTSAGTPPPSTAPVGQSDATLTVDVTDLRSRKGHLRLGVFTSAKGFPRERSGALTWKSLPADSDPARFALDLPPGDYAVVVLHDENGNKKLDTNLIGIPKEGYGVSNNPKPKRRAATFQEARFTLPPGGASMTVSIQYF